MSRWGQPHISRRESNHADCRIPQQVFGRSRISQGMRNDGFTPRNAGKALGKPRDFRQQMLVPCHHKMNLDVFVNCYHIIFFYVKQGQWWTNRQSLPDTDCYYRLSHKCSQLAIYVEGFSLEFAIQVVHGHDRGHSYVHGNFANQVHVVGNFCGIKV